MTNGTGQTTRTISRQDLERAGFSQEQITRIVAMRERYHPLIEEVETNHHWRCLQLLRWIYQEGRHPRG